MSKGRKGTSRILAGLVLGVILVLAAGAGAYLGASTMPKTSSPVTLTPVPSSPLIAPGQTQNYSVIQVASATVTGTVMLRSFAPQGLSLSLNASSVLLSPTPQAIPIVIKAEPGVPTGEYPVTIQVGSSTVAPENQTFYVDVVPMLVVMLYPGFYPQNITVAKGTRVTWINLNSEIGCCDPGLHDVSFLTLNVTSPLISRLQTWSYTFGEAGVFDYYCTVHPIMTGQVTVTG